MIITLGGDNQAFSAYEILPGRCFFQLGGYGG